MYDFEHVSNTLHCSIVATHWDVPQLIADSFVARLNESEFENRAILVLTRPDWLYQRL